MSVKYFAMTSHGRTGPWELWELPSAGVTPDTYVWCKGMPDWARASEVADICRFYRQRLAGVAAQGPEPPRYPDFSRETPAGDPDAQIKDSGESDANPSRRGFTFGRFPGIDPDQLPDVDKDDTDIDRIPQGLLIPAILVTLACFPVTGFVAIYYAVLSQRAWSASEHCSDPREARSYRRQAHDAVRNVKMWVGISFFLGLGFWASIVYFNI